MTKQTDRSRLGRLFTEASGRVDTDAVSRLLGGALLMGNGAIYLDQYLTSRSAPTLATMFAAQSGVAFALGAGLLALFAARTTAARRAAGSFSVQQVVAGGSALVALAIVSLYAYLLNFGALGHKAVPSAAGAVAAGVALAAFAVLGRLACSGLRPGIPAAPVRGVLASAALALFVMAEVVAAPLPAGATPGLKPEPVVQLADVTTPHAGPFREIGLYEGPVLVARRPAPAPAPAPAHVTVTVKAKAKAKNPKGAKSSHARTVRRPAAQHVARWSERKTA